MPVGRAICGFSRVKAVRKSRKTGFGGFRVRGGRSGARGVFWGGLAQLFCLECRQEREGTEQERGESMRGSCEWCGQVVPVNPDGTCFLGHPASVVESATDDIAEPIADSGVEGLAQEDGDGVVVPSGVPGAMGQTEATAFVPSFLGENDAPQNLFSGGEVSQDAAASVLPAFLTTENQVQGNPASRDVNWASAEESYADVADGSPPVVSPRSPLADSQILAPGTELDFLFAPQGNERRQTNAQQAPRTDSVLFAGAMQNMPPSPSNRGEEEISARHPNWFTEILPVMPPATVTTFLTHRGEDDIAGNIYESAFAEVAATMGTENPGFHELGEHPVGNAGQQKGARHKRRLGRRKDKKA